MESSRRSSKLDPLAQAGAEGDAPGHLEPDPTEARDGDGDARRHEVPVAVVEQRLSNLAQGALCLVLLTGPFLHVLGLIPRGVLAGLL